MFEWVELDRVLAFLTTALSSVLVILAFSLLAYTLTYNFRNSVARRYAFLLACVMTAYACDVALTRVLSAESANRWLRLQWISIALLPAAYYLFSLAVLRATNYRIQRRQRIAWITLVISLLSATSVVTSNWLVGEVHYLPPISYLRAGPFFLWFTIFYGIAVLLAVGNVWKARQRCLTDLSRTRMTYLLGAIIMPSIGIFPYLVLLSRLTNTEDASVLVLMLSLLVNSAVAVMIVLMSYTVAYFGVLTPDRVVRYRLVRFFFRAPIVAILVILAIQTLPRVEQLIGLPRDIVLFSVITGVIVLSQLFLSVTKTVVDRLVYREDRDEIAWLRELDRRLLTSSDLRQFLEHHLVTLCELLRVRSGFIAIVAGPDLILEVVVGPDGTHEQVMEVDDWSDALGTALKRESSIQPLSHSGFWIWPLTAPDQGENGLQVLGILGVKARTATPLISLDEAAVLDRMLENVSKALMDRQLQQGVFVALRGIIPEIDRIQQMRNAVPYLALESEDPPANALLNPSPIHSPEFEAWVKDALSHYWGGPKLTRSPLVQMQLVGDVLGQADGNPTKALRLVLGMAVEQLRPEGKQNLSAPEWLLYNILEMRFIQGKKVREIADRLAISESDLYRKQRVAIGQVARVLAEMEQGNAVERYDRLDPEELDQVKPKDREEHAPAAS
jgi:hypothetical protein